MIPFPQIDPEIVRIGPVAIRWYGMMYLLGFGASYLLVRRRLRKDPGAAGTVADPQEFISTLYTYLVLGLMVGARLGYVLFYDLGDYLQRPWEVLAVWKGGMSFHGGLIGSVIAGVLYCRKAGAVFLSTADIVIATAPIGIGLGRLGNFINGELFGRVADVPWAMVFPGGGPLARHPSQLYELLLEGVVLFLLLWILQDRLRKPGYITAAFLLLYGMFRSFAELFREPDAHLGFIVGQATMGQLLSAVMAATGIGLFLFARRQRPS